MGSREDSRCEKLKEARLERRNSAADMGLDLVCTDGRRGAGHRTSIACDSKALEKPGGVSVDVRDGREVRLVEPVDMPEMESDERVPDEAPNLEPGREGSSRPQNVLYTSTRSRIRRAGSGTRYIARRRQYLRLSRRMSSLFMPILDR